MILRKHIPNYVDGAEPAQWEVATKEELLALEWVAVWRDDSFEGLPFSRYSQSLHGKEYLLMGEWRNENKHKWWVIGYISEDAGLPEFKATH